MKHNNKLMNPNSSMGAVFARYVSQNIMGMLGVSCYIIADTYFISKAGGADGITILNLALPVYSLIFALGSMVGIGAATRFSILGAQGRAEAEDYMGGAIVWVFVISIPFILAGAISPGSVLRLMGGDEHIVALGTGYARFFLLFTPLFMLNYIFGAFVRNDEDPTRAMIATMSGCLFNIIFDYVFMFPCGMGVPGAALATAFAPGVSTLINSTHFFQKKNTLQIRIKAPSLRILLSSCPLGVSAFVGEFASAVTLAVFNFLILDLTGNIGVAAYGVVANYALVAMAIFNGISQGAQPLISEAYGKGQKRDLQKLLGLGLGTSVVAAVLIYGVVWLWTTPLVALFNSEGVEILAGYAFQGMRLYFVGFLFAGVNLFASGYLAATNQPKPAGIISVSRGIVAILVCAIVLAKLFGFTGIWCTFPAAEFITMGMVVYYLWTGQGSVSY